MKVSLIELCMLFDFALFRLFFIWRHFLSVFLNFLTWGWVFFGGGSLRQGKDVSCIEANISCMLLSLQAR